MPSLSENIPTGYIVPTGYITEVPYIELQGVGVERTLFEPEHELFRESYQKFLAQHVAPNHEKWEEQNIVDRDVWVEAGKQGFLGTAVPEEFGGGGVKDFPLQRDHHRGNHQGWLQWYRLHAAQRRGGAVPPGVDQRGAEAALATRIRVG